MADVGLNSNYRDISSISYARGNLRISFGEIHGDQRLKQSTLSRLPVKGKPKHCVARAAPDSGMPQLFQLGQRTGV